jgi:PAS domain S-box-containing protein
MVAHSHLPFGDVSCRATGYTVQQLQRMGLPTAHLTRGLAYTLDDLQSHSASIPWDDYLIFLRNSHTDLPTDQLVELCTSYKGSPHLRPFLSAAGLWFHPARYFQWVADPESGAIQQLFRCVKTRFTRVDDREVMIEEVVAPGFALPPDIFWETQSIAFGALTTYSGLGPSIVTWEPIERGASFRVRLPRRRPIRFVLSWLASWFRRDTAEDIRSALSFGHERSLRLEREIAERKTAEAARRDSEERFRRITDAVPGIVYQYYLDPDGRQGFVFVSGGATVQTGYTPDELIARPGLIWERIDPDDIPGVERSILESARNSTPWQRDFRFRTKAGESRWVRGRSIPEPLTGTGRVVWNGILTDVTAEKQSDSQLRTRDALLQKLSEQVPGFIYQYQQWPDGRGCFPYASEGIRDIYEVTPDEVRGSAASVYVRLHPDDLNAVAESIRRSLETLEPWGCEYRVVLPTRGTRWLDGHAAPERMPDGSTIWHGHIRDVTDRKLAEDSIRESESRFRTLIEDLEVGVVLQDETDRVLVSNDAAATTLGMTPDQLLGVTSMDLRWELVREDGTPLPPEQVPSVAAARTRRPVRNAVLGTFHRETGHRAWLQVNATPRLNADGSLRHVLVSLVDITERKRAEAALRESELRFRTLIETSSDAIFLMDLTGHIRSANPAAVRMHGYAMEELLAMRMQELDLPDDASVVPDRMRRLRAGESLTFEVVHRRKDGTTFPVEVIASAVEIGGEWLVLAFDRDITERKRGESVLRFQHALLRAQTEASPDGILVVDPANHILSYNHRFLDVWGIPDELPAAGDDTKVLARARTLAADPVAFGARVAAIYADPDTPSHDEVALADGRTLDRYSRPIRGADDELLGLVWYFRDITDRKQAETELRQSEERLRLALSAATAVAFVWDAATDSVVRYFSTEPALPVNPHAPESVTAVRANVHPDDRERFDAGIAACLADGSEYRNLYRVARPDGTVRWLEEWGTLDRDRTGLPVRLTGISIDVTERKEAEAALQLAERRQRLALDAGRMGTWDWEIGSDCLSWDASEQILFGFGPGEFDRRIDTFLNRVHPDDRPAVRQVLADAAAGKDFDGEFRIRLASGAVRWIHGSGVVVPKSDHTPPRMVGINYDITERKTAEAALRESEERLRIFAERAPAGVAMLDRDLRYLSYSRRWLTDYGLGDENLVGRSHYEVFPDVPDRWKEIHRRCLTGVSERCEQDRFDRADGAVDYVRWEIQPWTDATGAVGGLVFFTEMITDRVRAEDQVRASLREKEAMLKEIHHRVKNNLQVISSLLSLQAARVTHPAAAAVLSESQNRVRAMALVHETLYRSDDLARVDLSRYLEELCGYLFRSYGVDSALVRLELDVEPVTVSLDKTIPCGLLVNEIVSNSLKYAFPNTRSGTVAVGAHTRPDGHLTLTLTDDGVGLPAEIVVDRTPTLGLQLVNILTEQLGGQLTVERSPGTRFVISFAP